MAKTKTKDKAAEAATDTGKATPKKEWQVVWKDVNELTPYAKNARINDKTVPYLINSIKRFGFKVPLVIDSKGVIAAGHTRLKAALEIGMARVPCVLADDLTEDELRAFRLADNKIQEISQWDDDLADEEIMSLRELGFDMDDFGFGDMGTDWDNLGDVEGDLDAPKPKGANNTIIVTFPPDMEKTEVANLKEAVRNAVAGWEGCEVE